MFSYRHQRHITFLAVNSGVVATLLLLSGCASAPRNADPTETTPSFSDSAQNDEPAESPTTPSRSVVVPPQTSGCEWISSDAAAQLLGGTVTAEVQAEHSSFLDDCIFTSDAGGSIAYQVVDRGSDDAAESKFASMLDVLGDTTHPAGLGDESFTASFPSGVSMVVRFGQVTSQIAVTAPHSTDPESAATSFQTTIESHLY